MNALEAIHPGELARLVREAVQQWRDSELDEAIREAGRQALRDAARQWEEASQPAREELGAVAREYRDVLDRWHASQSAHAAAAAEVIDPLREQVAEANRALAELAEGYEDQPPGSMRRSASCGTGWTRRASRPASCLTRRSLTCHRCPAGGPGRPAPATAILRRIDREGSAETERNQAQ